MPKLVNDAPPAYWLSGEQRCPHCLLAYTFAVERRCAACDGPACPHCVELVRETREVLCLPCTRAQDD